MVLPRNSLLTHKNPPITGTAITPQQAAGQHVTFCSPSSSLTNYLKSHSGDRLADLTERLLKQLIQHNHAA
jgi:hypothetical protein